MADPKTYRPESAQIPTLPGVYRFRDAEGRPIYVGKAKSLRSRLNSYFQDLDRLHFRTKAMVLAAHSVDWTVVANEMEALQLEWTWIKEFEPRFNVRFRDDKSYPWLAITVNEQIPRVFVVRGERKKGIKYFGPYPHAWAIRETVDQMLRVFPMRSCSNGVYRRAQLIGRPCLLGDIGKCSAPCVERVSPAEHSQIVGDFVRFLSGRSTPYLRRLQKEMKEASEKQEYELAARLRDDLQALTKALEKTAVVLSDDTDADIIAIEEDQLEVAVHIFKVRGGRIRGQRGWIADRVGEIDSAGLIEKAIVTLYDNEHGDEIPKLILVPTIPTNAAVIEEWLTDLRGGNVQIKVPKRGDRHDLLNTVAANAKEALLRHKIRRSGDLTIRSKALDEIKSALELPEAPLRIECFDISNLGETNAVASMVVFEDGLPAKKYYRKFAIHTPGQNDAAAIAEVITRRFSRPESPENSAETPEPIDQETGKPKRFAYRPNLVVVDGGQPQVNAAQRALDDLGISDIALCGLAKRLEEVWLPGIAEPVILPRNSEALYLLQRVRDEAHRTAIGFHRKKRSRAMTRSKLDDIPGLGPARKQLLLDRFGSVKKIRAATVEDISELPGIGPTTAAQIVRVLAQETSSINTATGEVISE